MKTVVLESTFNKGILDLPGCTPDSKQKIKQLLTSDYNNHHCFFNAIGLHNHLPHHLVAAYDLGAPAHTLQAIYHHEKVLQRPPDLSLPPDEIVSITEKNWTERLGDHKAYLGYLDFFSAQVKTNGPAATTGKYIFSPEANANDARMLARFVGGALHPMIQFGCGAESDEQLLIASSLAQTALTTPGPLPLFPSTWPYSPPPSAEGTLSLLAVLRQMYDSPLLTPVLPYDPNALLRHRVITHLSDGRPEEIIRIADLWALPSSSSSSTAPDSKEWDSKIEEIFYLSTLLTCATHKPNRKPRLDFFLMHTLTSALFLPSIFKYIKNPEHRRVLLRSYLRTVLFIILIRGRPRIDPELIMSYSQFPSPPPSSSDAPPRKKEDNPDALGLSEEEEEQNPWPAIITTAIHVPDAHTAKTIRSLLYAAQHYGTTFPPLVPGAFHSLPPSPPSSSPPAGVPILSTVAETTTTETGNEQTPKEETHLGSSKLDGTLFVRAAGLVLDVLGWADHGDKKGEWDRSALGWDGAWEGED